MGNYCVGKGKRSSQERHAVSLSTPGFTTTFPVQEDITLDDIHSNDAKEEHKDNRESSADIDNDNVYCEIEPLHNYVRESHTFSVPPKNSGIVECSPSEQQTQPLVIEKQMTIKLPTFLSEDERQYGYTRKSHRHSLPVPHLAVVEHQQETRGSMNVCVSTGQSHTLHPHSEHSLLLPTDSAFQSGDSETTYTYACSQPEIEVEVEVDAHSRASSVGYQSDVDVNEDEISIYSREYEPNPSDPDCIPYHQKLFVNGYSSATDVEEFLTQFHEHRICHTLTITNNGTSVYFSANEFQVVVPHCALPQSTEVNAIIATSKNADDFPDETQFGIRASEIIHLYPHGAQFLKPLLVKFKCTVCTDDYVLLYSPTNLWEKNRWQKCDPSVEFFVIDDYCYLFVQHFCAYVLVSNNGGLSTTTILCKPVTVMVHTALRHDDIKVSFLFSADCNAKKDQLGLSSGKVIYISTLYISKDHKHGDVSIKPLADRTDFQRIQIKKEKLLDLCRRPTDIFVRIIPLTKRDPFATYDLIFEVHQEHYDKLGEIGDNIELGDLQKQEVVAINETPPSLREPNETCSCDLNPSTQLLTCSYDAASSSAQLSRKAENEVGAVCGARVSALRSVDLAKCIRHLPSNTLPYPPKDIEQQLCSVLDGEQDRRSFKCLEEHLKNISVSKDVRKKLSETSEKWRKKNMSPTLCYLQAWAGLKRPWKDFARSTHNKRVMQIIDSWVNDCDPLYESWTDFGS